MVDAGHQRRLTTATFHARLFTSSTFDFRLRQALIGLTITISIFSLATTILTSLVPLARAALTHAACRDNHCIQYNRLGNLCFHPSPDVGTTPSCKNVALRAVLEKHLNPAHRSIGSTAYYRLRNAAFIGGPGWPLDESDGKVTICHTGHVANDTFYTTCRIAVQDNDFDLATTRTSTTTGTQHSQVVDECARLHSHDERVLREGCCGFPRADCPPSRDPAWRHLVDNIQGWQGWPLLRAYLPVITGVISILITVLAIAGRM